MAEVKEIHDYDVGIPTEISDKVVEKPKQPKKKSDPNKGITRLEKILFFALVFCSIGLAFFTVRLRTDIIKVTGDITTIESEMTDINSQITLLEQERNELSRVERVKEIAEKAGLSSIEENIRKVNP